MRSRVVVLWCQHQISSLADVYPALNVSESHGIWSYLESALEQWSYAQEPVGGPVPSDEDWDAFLRTHVKRNPLAIEIRQRKYDAIRNSYSELNKFDSWFEYVFYYWSKEKMKSIKRRLARRRTSVPATTEALPMTPAKATRCKKSSLSPPSRRVVQTSPRAAAAAATTGFQTNLTPERSRPGAPMASAFTIRSLALTPSTSTSTADGLHTNAPLKTFTTINRDSDVASDSAFGPLRAAFNYSHRAGLNPFASSPATTINTHGSPFYSFASDEPMSDYQSSTPTPSTLPTVAKGSTGTAMPSTPGATRPVLLPNVVPTTPTPSTATPITQESNLAEFTAATTSAFSASLALREGNLPIKRRKVAQTMEPPLEGTLRWWLSQGQISPERVLAIVTDMNSTPVEKMMEDPNAEITHEATIIDRDFSPVEAIMGDPEDSEVGADITANMETALTPRLNDCTIDSAPSESSESMDVDSVVKAEPSDYKFEFTNLPDDPIVLSDSDQFQSDDDAPLPSDWDKDSSDDEDATLPSTGGITGDTESADNTGATVDAGGTVDTEATVDTGAAVDTGDTVGLTRELPLVLEDDEGRPQQRRRTPAPAIENIAPLTPEPPSHDEYDAEDEDEDGRGSSLSLERRRQIADLVGSDVQHKELRRDQGAQSKEFEIPLRPKYQLKPWQRLAITFLEQCAHQYGVALLGDEMGIGKTIQALGYLWMRIHKAVVNKERKFPNRPRLASFIVMPVSLQNNWLKETRKFFHSRDLKAKPWSLDAWQNDTSPYTIWLVRDSLLNMSPFEDLMRSLNSGVEVLSLFADEAHVAFRSMKSNRAVQFRRLGSKSAFVAFLSGTLFPMGPCGDARGLMECLGQHWSQPNTKWNGEQRSILSKLFDRGGGRGWNVRMYRRLITPFYLCRDIDSTWKGAYIIERIRKRPIPEIVVPDDAAYEAELTALLREQGWARNADGTVNIQSAKLRTDQIKKMAWSRIYFDFGREESCAKMQAKISALWDKRQLTSRIRDLRDEIVKINTQYKERFVICADSKFLLCLATYLCEKVLGLRIGVLAGDVIYGHKNDNTTRSQAVDDLNAEILDGLVISGRVGGVGHNLVGANHVLYMGSQYSLSYENQILARISREGQRGIPHAKIFGNPNWIGDAMAFAMKESRGEGEAELKRMLSEGELGRY